MHNAIQMRLMRRENRLAEFNRLLRQALILPCPRRNHDEIRS